MVIHRSTLAAHDALVCGGDPLTRGMVRSVTAELGLRMGSIDTLAPLAPAPRGAGDALLLVILDEPETTYLPTLAALRSGGYSGPTVLLAQRASWDLRRRAFALGVADVIRLPAPREEVRARLRALMAEQCVVVDTYVPQRHVAGGAGR